MLWYTLVNMRIAVLGGSFDPPHLGHIFMARQIKETYNIDEVWLLPLFKQGFDRFFEKKLSSFEDRYAMCKLIENEFIKASTFEKDENPSSRTIETLEKLIISYPNDEFFWVMGTDQLINIQKYYEWEKIVKKQNLIIFPREYLLPDLHEIVLKNLNVKKIPENIFVMDSKDLILTNISSTKIRNRVNKNLPIDYMVSKEVNNFIKLNKLYV